MNEFLHALTNREVFASPMFPTVTTFRARPQTPNQISLRQTLQLHVITHDYFVHGLLAAFYSFPELVECFPETRTFELRDFRRAPDSWVGATPAPDQHGPFVMRRRATEFPVQMRMTLSYVDATHMRISLGSESWAVPAYWHAGTLYPEWPAELGVSGALLVADWSSAFEATVQHMPINYPYEACVAALENVPFKNTMLLQVGLMEHYYFAATPFEKVAAAALALALSNQ